MAYGSSGLAYIYPRPTTGGTDERLTVSTSAVSFATNWDDGITKLVVLDVQTANVMVTFDGSTPSASNGHLMESGTKETWNAGTAKAAKFIRAGASDAAIHASPFTF